jgi:transposase-like protein
VSIGPNLYVLKKTRYGRGVKAFRSTNSIFHDDGIARAALEALRWPDGPVCPKASCRATGPAVAKMGGVKRSHRDGLYRCRSCRGQFTVTVGTAFGSSKVPLSKWMQAVHEVGSSENPPTLLEIQKTIGVTYKTTLQIWGRICTALGTYKGYKKGFGTKVRAVIREAQPNYAHEPKRSGYWARKNKLMAAGRHPSQHTIKATGLLSSFERDSARTDNLERTERLLRILIATDPERHRAARRKASKSSRASAPNDASSSS